MSKRIVWIDMTDMAGWSGLHGGTQRVVYGIAEEYHKHKKADEVRFFVFEPVHRKFYSYDFEIIRQRVADMAKRSEGDPSELPKKALLKEKIIRLVPGPVLRNDTIRHSGKRALKAGLKFGKRAHVAAVDLRRKLGNGAVMTNAEEVVFGDGDTVLLPGKPWDNPTLVPTLADLKKQNGFKIAAVVYDMIIPLYPHLHSELLFKNYTQFAFELAQCADVLFPISQSTADDFKRFCDKLSLPCPQQKVIRLGDRLETVKKLSKPDGPIATNYILCVGTIEVRKNHALLYYAYKLAQQKNVELPQLIVVGRLGWNANDIYALMKGDQSVRSKLMIMESVSDSELAWLYSNCLFTVYPSMYEGWGLPVAESIQYGKAVICSNVSSMPEIAGDLIEYFSPYSTDELLVLLQKYLDVRNRSHQEDIIKKGCATTEWLSTYEQVKSSIALL